MPQPLQLLLAEDSPQDAELVLRALRRSGFEPNWTRVDTEADFLSSLHTDLDIVISDYDMPQFNGSRALALLHERDLDVPFIIISGKIDEDAAVAVMKQGATDYLMKDRLTRLGESVNQAMEKGRLRRQNREAEAKMREQLAELLRWQDIMLGREDRVQDLKAEVNELCGRLKQPPRYGGENVP